MDSHESHTWELKHFLQKNFENVLVVQKKALPLHPQSRNKPRLRKQAEIAQLVEHNLAKVRVASSSLVFRSKGQNLTSALAQVAEW